ncbi:dienelactone hydrolase family protein [Nonomuraea sp. FMUSA5-5]|uniref:Dienelactone hydrolase family protein n=1 Tax=Nonomuraea composti TaxID=2720023 RepID=A0ABX1BIB2_9ACTN|nr:dienelactone hydrolase family protein [Nonomuraea sp. FMUSA5-5]NJP94818.1 dienelactone hydrolase family protein [Nonomuraea sp. FMUSA5-5]
MRTRIDTLTTADGSFDAYIWLPAAGTGPGILLLQEIFGVGPYIEKVARDLSELGYVVLAPELFWRIRRNWRGDHSERGVAEALDLSRDFDFAQGVADSALALSHLRTLPEVRGGVGSVGFCLGGGLNYALADTMDAVVSFYGSTVPAAAGDMSTISSPLLLVFGGKDEYIPRDRVAVVEEAARDLANVEVYVAEEAGHAFHNHEAPMFYHPEAAAAVWSRAVGFLGTHLPVIADGS